MLSRVSPVRAFVLSVSFLVGLITSAGAQNKPTLRSVAQAAAPQLALPSAEKLVLLIRSSLLTLNDAIETGNYTVLRDKSAPSFQQANTASKLSRIFGHLEVQNVDLAAVAVLTPQLTEAKIVGQEQRLHLKGAFPSQPIQINFTLILEPAGGRWRIFGLAVSGNPPAQPSPQSNALIQAPTSKK